MSNQKFISACVVYWESPGHIYIIPSDMKGAFVNMMEKIRNHWYVDNDVWSTSYCWLLDSFQAVFWRYELDKIAPHLYIINPEYNGRY